MTPHQTPHPLVDTWWMVNDSGRLFRVARVQHQYAYVVNEHGHERRILAHAIKQSNAKTGYTRVASPLERAE